jgi:formylglycine-generating enzyme required for sulfatase activity
LALRQVEWAPPADVLPLLVATVTPADEAYVAELHHAWEAVGIEMRVDMGPAFYRRGQDFYKRRDYPAAVADFDRAIGLGVPGAIDRREKTLQVMSEVAQREVEPEKLRQAQAEAERLRQEAEENLKGKLFSFETVYVDNRGNIERREQKEARCLTIDLGGGVPLEMVYIPGGSFLMGGSDKEQNSSNDERPQHEVTLQPFHMAKYPITQQQYQAVMDRNPSDFKGDRRPVERVSWHDAVAFCQKLSGKVGQQFSLPSEAQWEYACRAGTTTPFHFGATISAEIVNYDASNTYGNGSKGKYPQQTTDVGIFPPNAFGLYDMHGNVWEWCQDNWHHSYNGAPTDGSAWNIGGNSNYVLRGGAWDNYPYRCRSANRYGNSPVIRFNSNGFRVVVVVAAPSTPHRQNR